MRKSSLPLPVAFLSLVFVLLLAGGCPRVSPAPDGLGTENYPPVAVAFASGGRDVGDGVSLDASGSYDPNLDAELTYAWTIDAVPSGAAPELRGADTDAASFTPTVTGQHLVTLTVSDGTYRSQATVVVNVGTGGGVNQAPTAVITGPTDVEIGTAATFDGSGSNDPEGASLTFLWALTAVPTGSTVLLVDATTASQTFTPDLSGAYTLELTVNDGALDSTVATFSLLATDPALNNPPVATITGPVLVQPGDLVTLDGTGSLDPDGDTITYLWSLDSGPAGASASLSATTTDTTSFTADLAGAYALTLIVDDGQLQSSDTIVVTADAVPTALIASLPSAVQVGATVNLDGSGSSDPEGQALTFAWTLTTPGGSGAVLTPNDTVAQPSFVADVAGAFTLRLIVSDGTADSVAAVANVSARASTGGNSAPVANAGPDQTAVAAGTEVVLDGSASSDFDLDPLRYAWSFTQVPAGAAVPLLRGAGTVAPSFDAAAPGIYLVVLVVDDGRLSSAPDAVTITAVDLPPVADAGINFSTPTGVLTSLDGSASSDPNGDPLSFGWTLVSTPGGSSAALLGATSITPAFLPDVDGAYVFDLVVNDGSQNSVPASVTVTASLDAPIADPGQPTGVFIGETALLDGSASLDPRPIPGPLTYAWRVVGQPGPTPPVLLDANTATPSFVASERGLYRLVLAVTNDVGDTSVAAEVTVTARFAPEIHLGPDFLAVAGNAHYYPRLFVGFEPGNYNDTVDGLAAPGRYKYTFVTAPVGSALEGEVNLGTYYYPGPDLPGDYVIVGELTDAFGAVATDSVSFTAEEPILIVTAGEGQNVVAAQKLSTPILVQITTASGLPVSNSQLLRFQVPGFAPALIQANGAGLASSGVLPVGRSTGALPIEIWMDNDPSIRVTATVNVVAGPIAAILFETPADTSLDASMTLRGQAVDAFFNPTTETGFEATITSGGSAVFGAVVTGTEISRADNQNVVFQTAGGLIEIVVSDTVVGLVDFGIVDSAGNGARGLGRVVYLSEDFEVSDGTPDYANDAWANNPGVNDFAWGVPIAGPASAHSGTRLWGTNLVGDHALDSESVLEWRIDLRSALSLPDSVTFSLWHYSDHANAMCRGAASGARDAGAIAFVAMDTTDPDDLYNAILMPLPLVGEATYDGTQQIVSSKFWPYSFAVPGWTCSTATWRKSSFDLSQYIGRKFDVQIYFVNQSADTLVSPGFYFDDLQVDGVAEGTTGRFVVGAPAKVAIVRALGGRVGVPVVLEFEVQDAFAQLASTDDTSTFSVSVGGSATVRGATVGTILSGVGTATLQVQASGGRVALLLSDTVRESVTVSLGNPTPVLDVTATATLAFTGAPAAICDRGGDGQSAFVNSALPAPLQVQVIDEIDCASLTALGVADGVTFSSSPGDASLFSPAAVATDGSGSAQTTFTLPGTDGVISVTATLLSDPTLTVGFTATAILDPGAPRTVVLTEPVSLQVGSLGTVGLEVRRVGDLLDTADSSSVIMLRTTGSAYFGAVLSGTEISRTAQGVEVQVSAGTASIELGAVGPGFFPVWTEDSSGTGFTMAPLGFDGFVWDHPYANDVVSHSQIDFLVPPGLTGEGLATFKTDADVDSSSEYWMVDVLDGGVFAPLGNIYDFWIGFYPLGAEDTITLPASAVVSGSAAGAVSLQLQGNGVSSSHSRRDRTDLMLLDARLQVPGAMGRFYQNNYCFDAEFVGRGTFYRLGTTRGAGNNFSTACDGTSEPGNDVVYAFVAPASGSARISVTPLEGQNVDWSLVTRCVDPMASCVLASRSAWSGSPERYTGWSATLQQGVTYFLIVDSPSAGGGDFEVAIAFEY